MTDFPDQLTPSFDDGEEVYRPRTVEQMMQAAVRQPPLPIIPTVALMADIVVRLLEAERTIRELKDGTRD